MQTKSPTKPINLKTISLLLLNNDLITSNISIEGKVITASELALSIPSLKKLGDTPLVKVITTESGNKALIPTLYRFDNEVMLVMPDINASFSTEFIVNNWEAGDFNQAIVNHKESDICLVINIAYQPWFIEDIRVRHDNSIKSDSIEKLDANWLKDAPRIEHHLSNLPHLENLTILGLSDRRSEKYNTLLIDVKTSQGKVYKNVITNSALRSLIADDIEQFKITDVKPVNLKNQNSTKRQDRTSLKVFLEPVINADLSGL